MKVAIIGAGYAGMSAGWDLVRNGNEVAIFEASSEVGGLAAGFTEPHWDWSVEKYYHHWFESDTHMRALIEELGLSDQVLFPRPYTVMLHNGKWYPFDSIIKALLFPGLGWGITKIRFGLVGLYLRLTDDWKTLEKYTVDTWMRKWAGSKVYEIMWEPLMEGKFGPYARDVNMAWMWARLKARTTRLGTYKGGFQKFSDDFASKLRSLGVEIRLECAVEKIASIGDGVVGVQTPEGTQIYDQCLVTISPSVLARMAPDLPEDYLSGLLSLKHMGALVMTLSLKHSISEQGYYWYNIPKNAGYPFLALVEHTNYLSIDYFGGEYILYCGDYLPTDHEYFDLSDEELLERFIPGIQRINPSFEREWVNKFWVHKTKYAQPVPLLNHSQNIPAIETPVSGLYFASMSQVYPWDRGTNFAVEIGRRAARLMMEKK
jgi:protoporphyrinogen oxidase